MAFARFAAPLLSLFAVACGGSGDPTAGKSDEQLRREIEAVAVPKPLPEDKPPPFRLRPLKVGEVRDFAAEGPACMLVYENRIFFAARGAEGIARMDGRVTRLQASGPVGGSGGFFRAPGATLSIGRVGQYAPGAQNYVAGWPAEVAVGGAKEIKPQEFEASWTCRNLFSPDQIRPFPRLWAGGDRPAA